MHSNIGLWIDHRKAVIVVRSGSGEDVSIVQSGAERQPGRIDGEKSSESFESQHVQADDVRDRKFTQHLNAFYDEVIACIHQAESLLIFGPGEAKGELAKRLALEKPAERTVRIETADKMTDHQIAARVSDHFHRESRGLIPTAE